MRRPILASILAAALLLPAIAAPNIASADIEGLDEEEIAALETINAIRVNLGLPALKISPILSESAEWMAEDLADHDTIDHTDSLGRSMADRIYAFGYPTTAYIRENLVVGTFVDSGEEAVEAWQDSPGHRANNEADDVTVAGIARVYAPDTEYKWFWALNLGSYEDEGTVTLAQLQQAPVSGDPPVGDEEGTFAFDFPSSGIGLNAWNGGSLDEMVEGARQGGARSIYITVNGRWVGYSIAGPEFVNANFMSEFSEGDVPEGSVILIVI